jgi:hypothetical protein
MIASPLIPESSPAAGPMNKAERARGGTARSPTGSRSLMDRLRARLFAIAMIASASR